MYLKRIFLASVLKLKYHIDSTMETLQTFTKPNLKWRHIQVCASVRWCGEGVLASGVNLPPPLNPYILSTPHPLHPEANTNIYMEPEFKAFFKTGAQNSFVLLTKSFWEQIYTKSNIPHRYLVWLILQHRQWRD